jgi:hypothetical protein
MIRFPENLNGYNDSWILFTTQRPTYQRKNQSIGATSILEGGEIVALYFPTGHTISDNLNYESYEPGIAGLIYNRVFGNETSDTEELSNTDIAAGATSSALRGIGSAISGGTAARNQQKVTNPREFMMFRSPGIREFSFSFTFIPQSQAEASSVPEIIHFFRKAAYPEETSGIEYKFPDAFNIQYKASSDIIKIPEVVCTAVTVTYNPNSISFFRNNGMPVETTLELSFMELRPISRGLVEEGY